MISDPRVGNLLLPHFFLDISPLSTTYVHTERSNDTLSHELNGDECTVTTIGTTAIIGSDRADLGNQTSSHVDLRGHSRFSAYHAAA